MATHELTQERRTSPVEFLWELVFVFAVHVGRAWAGRCSRWRWSRLAGLCAVETTLDRRGLSGERAGATAL